MRRFFHPKIIRKKSLKKSSFVNPLNRKKAIKIDNYICQDCGADLDNLSGDGVHHIIFKSEIVNDNLYNLISMCFSCHRYAHDGRMINGERITARQYMIDLLDNLERFQPKKFRWKESLEALKRKRK